MALRGGGAMWNTTSKKIEQQEKDEINSVDKLRSIYSTLLAAIAPTSQYNQFDLSLNTDEEHENMNQVQNFRSNIKSMTSDIDQYQDEISFEAFHQPASNALESVQTWKSLAATQKLEAKPMDDYSFDDNEDAVAALIQARKLESRVVQLIKDLGEVVVYGEQRQNYVDTFSKTMKHGNEAVFDYFCDKNMLALLVDIVLTNPSNEIQDEDQEERYSGITWTAIVKAQVLQSITILISNTSDPKSLYYLLSNNYINEMIVSIIPLQQWKPEALDEILPVYISFLKTLTLKLTKAPELCHFFCDMYGQSSKLPTFPLMYAAVEVVSSPVHKDRSDDFVYSTALNIILTLYKLPGNEMKNVISELYMEQNMLIQHLSNELILRCDGLSKILETDGEEQNKLLSMELTKLESSLVILNDLLWSCERSVTVGFCEHIIKAIMQSSIIENFVEFHDSFMSLDGNLSNSCCASIIVISKILEHMDYVPLLKMVAVAVLHPYTPSSKQIEDMEISGKEFVMTPALNAIAQDEYVVVDDAIDASDFDNNIDFSNAGFKDSTTHIVNTPTKDLSAGMSISAIDNPCRDVIFKLMSGELGTRLFIAASMLLENAFLSKAVDDKTINKLQIVSSFQKEKNILHASLDLLFRSYSSSKVSLHESELYLRSATALIYKDLSTMLSGIKSMKSSSLQHNLDLLRSIDIALKYFASESMRMKNIFEVESMFTELVQQEISDLYSNVDTSSSNNIYQCDLKSLNSKLKADFVSCIINRESKKELHQTKEARLIIRSFLLIQVLRDFYSEVVASLNMASDVGDRWNDNAYKISQYHPASNAIRSLGCLGYQSIVGTSEILDDRPYFVVEPSIGIGFRSQSRDDSSDKTKRRQLADTILAKGHTKLILVIDEREVLVLRQEAKDNMRNCTILLSTLLSNIIHMRDDYEALHIALKEVEDIGVLINKGNMVLRFEDGYECRHAKRVIEDSRSSFSEAQSLEFEELIGSILRKS